MHEDAAGGSGAKVEVRFAADPASVPGARRIVVDTLVSWQLADLVDDAALCVSELAANAALHSGSAFMRIGVLRVGDAVRLSVEDVAIPVEAVIARSRFPGPEDPEDHLRLEHEPTTGRGLGIVSILASNWGVEETEGGKRTWAEVTSGSEEHEVRPPKTGAHDGQPSHQAMSGQAQPHGDGLPPGWTLVRLLGCPVELSLRQDEHLDELIRELQLIASDQANPGSQALALQLRGLLSGPAHARHTGRRIAQEAATAGKQYINVDMAMPTEFSIEVQKLQTAVQAADVLCEELRLLTLASSPELRALRAWMTDQLVSQIERGADPVSWQNWAAAHI